VGWGNAASGEEIEHLSLDIWHLSFVIPDVERSNVPYASEALAKFTSIRRTDADCAEGRQ
jgi:hypothetical protein